MSCTRCLALLVCLGTLTLGRAESPTRQPPRFTEEREAAALHFVKKNLKELVPVLEQLKKGQPSQYEREIGEIFQVTEWLADLKEDTLRHDLELSIWVHENKAFLLVAKLGTPNKDERDRITGQLQELARELVDLEIKVLTHKGDVLRAELTANDEELAAMSQNRDKRATERYAELLKKLNQGKKP